MYRGFAFVVMEGPEIVDKILADDKHVIGGREIDCKKALPPEQYQVCVGVSECVCRGLAA